MVCLYQYDQFSNFGDQSMNIFLFSCLQEFRGVGGLNGSTELESDMTSVPLRTMEILASCHALVFVDNKLVSFLFLELKWCLCLLSFFLIGTAGCSRYMVFLLHIWINKFYLFIIFFIVILTWESIHFFISCKKCKSARGTPIEKGLLLVQHKMNWAKSIILTVSKYGNLEGICSFQRCFFFRGRQVRVYFNNQQIDEEGKILVNGCFHLKGMQNLVTLLCFGVHSGTNCGH